MSLLSSATAVILVGTILAYKLIDDYFVVLFDLLLQFNSMDTLVCGDNNVHRLHKVRLLLCGIQSLHSQVSNDDHEAPQVCLSLWNLVRSEFLFSVEAFRTAVFDKFELFK